MQADALDQHQPVLLSEVIGALKLDSNGIYIDCTFGRGGHSSEILKGLGDKGRLLAMDQDPEAVMYGKKAFKNEPRIAIEHCNFSQILQVTKKYDFDGKVNGILFDLGVSSPQLNDPNRGFSFMKDGPLDMRMNFNAGISAAEWLQDVSENELERVIKTYGEERHARKIAKAILQQQKISSLSTTKELADLIEQTIGRSREKKHPATRTFQAIRIFINDELKVLASALDDCIELLAQSGRLLVITFHSLEDQLVKSLYRKHSESDVPRKLPIVDQFQPELKRVCKPIKPTKDEILENPRARSAKLYVLERVAC